MPSILAVVSRRAIIGAIVCPAALLAISASAQIVVNDRIPPDAAPNGSVNVNPSTVAVDKMAQAERLESLKDWNKSAEVYQEIIEKYRDWVVPSGVDAGGVIDQYTSVSRRATEHLRAWPPEGVAAYNTHYDLPAKTLMQSAHGDDLGPLHEVFTRYFLTDSAKLAGIKLIDAYFELGDYSAATWIGQELLLHPNLADDRPKVLFRLGLASHMIGDDEAAAQSLQELKDKFPAAVATIAGRDVTLADELAADLNKLNSASDNKSSAISDSWPMFAGSPSRDRVYASQARPGAKLYSISLAQPDWKSLNNADALKDTENSWRSSGSSMGVMPVADRGELFFQDNAHVYAVTLDRGGPIPAWHSTYPNTNGVFILDKAWNMPAGHQFTVTLSDSAVLAVMDLPDPLISNSNNAAESGGNLVCLDRATGKLNWTVAAHGLNDADLKVLDFESSPLVVGTSVYLAARGSKGNGDENCYVLCFDLGTGALRWSCFVASAPSESPAIFDPNRVTTPIGNEIAHLAYSSGRVFVSTNLGAVAAMDAYSGQIAWLNIYRDPGEGVNTGLIMPGRGFGRFGGFGGPFGGGGGFNPGVPFAPPTPWTANPPVVHDGNVFILPDDGKYILVYDAGDGHLVKKLNKSDCCVTPTGDSGPDSTAPKTLVGILDGAVVNVTGGSQTDDLLLVATADYVCAIKWRTYDPDHHEDALAWKTTESTTGHIMGRPFLTDDSVYIPSTTDLYRVSVRSGAVAEVYPANVSANWPADEGPGNTIVCGDHIIIAGDQRVSVYTDIDLAKTKLDNEVASAPADPSALLHYAEVMFLANDPELAAAKLDQAMRLLGSDTAAHDRAFTDALNFAMKSWRSKSPDAQTKSLFDRAASLARTAEQQVKYRMSRALFARIALQDLPTAVKLYQDILADNLLRTAVIDSNLTIPPPTPNPGDIGNSAPVNLPPANTQAGPLAEKALDLILRKPGGLAAYQPYEQTAQAEASAASIVQDPDRLAAVADNYPNSTVAAPSLQKAADIYEAKGQYEKSIHMLRRIYAGLNADPERVAVLQTMAQNYLHLPGGLPAAVGRLSAALKLAPDANLTTSLRLPDGSVIEKTPPITLEQALRRLDPLLSKAQGAASAADPNSAASADLPTLGLPPRAVKQDYYIKYNKYPAPLIDDPKTPTIPGITKLLPLDQRFSRYDRLVTWTANSGLSIYPVGSPQPLGAAADVTDEPAGAAWTAGKSNLLVWTGPSVMLIAADQVTTRWRIDLAPLDNLQLLAQAAPAAPPTLLQPLNGMVLRRLTRSMPMPNQQLFAINRAAPTSPAQPADDANTAPAPEQVATVQPIGDLALVSTTTGRVMAVNLTTGAIVWQIRVVPRAPDRVLATGDFTVIKASDSNGTNLVVLDTLTGRLLARQAYTTDAANLPLNIALGDDGNFAFTTTIGALEIFDLFDLAQNSALDSPAAVVPPTSPATFQGMSQPNQLLINDGTVLALTDGGRLLRGYDVSTGSPRTLAGGKAMQLPTFEVNNQAFLAVNQRYVYAWGPRTIIAYDLENPEANNWRLPADGWNRMGVPSQLLFARDYLLSLNQPAERSDGAVWWMVAFNRARVPSESGRLDYQYQPQTTGQTRILSWQLIDGGICYLTDDHTLHIKRGNATPAPPPASDSTAKP